MILPTRTSSVLTQDSKLAKYGRRPQAESIRSRPATEALGHRAVCGTFPRMPAIRIGYSPDPDDAFMFYALAAGKVEARGHELRFLLEDLESLNRKARSAELEITAIQPIDPI